MKRIVSMILSLSFVFSGTLAFSAEAEKEIPDYALSLNFDSDKSGAQPSGFDYLSVKNKDEITIADVPDSGNKSVKIQSTGFTNSVAHYTPPSGFFDGKENTIFEFDIMMERYGQGSGYFSVHTQNTVKGTAYTIFLAKVSESGNFTVGDSSSLYRFMTGKFYKVALNIKFADRCADVYVNHKLIAENVSLGTNFSKIGWIRYNIDKCTDDGNNPIYYLDNVAIYNASAPEFVINKSALSDVQLMGSESVMEKYMNSTLCFYLNQDTYAINGKVEKFDESNRNIITKNIGGSACVPCDIFLNSLKLTSEQTGSAVIISDGKVRLTLNKGEFSYYEDLLYVPVRKVAEFFGYKVSYDKSGLIVIGSRENHFALDTSDIAYFRELTYKMCCDEPTADEVYMDITSGNLSHPRILVNQDRINVLKNYVQTNPEIKKWYDNLKASATKALSEPLYVYKADSYAGILAISQSARSRIPLLAFIYLMEGDEAYAQKAYEQLEAVVNFPDWYPYRGLDTAEMSLAVGIGYDWLYNYMTPQQRATIKKGLIEKGLNVAMEDYTGEYTYFHENGRSRSTYWTTLGDAPHNWVWVCNDGALVGAMAIADEEPDLSSKIISYGLENWGKALRYLAPDGVWTEGPMYNNWMLLCMTNAFSSLENTFGTTYGLMDMPGVTEFPKFNASFISTVAPFNFGNVEPTYGNTNSNGTYYMASYTGDVAMAQLRTYAIDTYDEISMGLQDFLYIEPEYLTPGVPSDKDEVYSIPGGLTMFMFRSNPVSKNSVNLAATADNCMTYAQADMGSYIIDAYGTRFAQDIGKANYDGVWFDQYKNRAEGHNVIVINPDSTPGFALGTLGSLEKTESDDDEAYAIFDLSNNYKENATSAKRGYFLTEGRDRIIIQDEIKANKPSEMYWFMHTACDIEISEDGKSAILKGDLKDMHLRIDSNVDAKFTVMNAALLPTSPTSDKSVNKKYKKLTIHMTDVTELSLSVVMDFEYPYLDLKKPMPEKKALDSWALSADSGKVKPALNMIYLNGSPLENFEKGETAYKCILPAGSSVPKVTATGNGNINVKGITEIPGTAIIEVTDNNGNKNEYGVVIEYVKQIVRPENPLNMHDKCGLPIYIVTASQIFQEENIPENMVDGDPATRWVGTGDQYVDFDFGSLKTVGSVAFSVYSALSDGRKQSFDVLLSEDGINWKTVIEGGITSGETEELEQFSFEPAEAVYARLYFHGNSVNTYDSITEVRFFSK
ncbi:MAG: discoidin domain-containing protein [Clostridia bacterium]|nr:discoidin domain-containing protein [Clostridia bacterium]